jgi:subtilase family serine protease
VTISSTAAPGTYYIVAKADADNAVAETSETNNTYSKSLVVVGPDLTVLAVTAGASAGQGETITVGDTTRNSGVEAAPASKTYFYLSSDSSLDAADIYLGSRDVPALAAGASNTGTIPVTLPGSMAPGTWYIIAKADGPEAVAEASETNNTYSKSLVVVGPDLIILTLTGPTTVKPGQVINLSEATRNQGSRATTVNTVARFYWSTNSTLDASDVPLGERVVGSLAAGATSGPVSTSVTISSTAAPGTYYIVAKADADNAVTEASDTNNTRYLAVRVSP